MVFGTLGDMNRSTVRGEENTIVDEFILWFSEPFLRIVLIGMGADSYLMDRIYREMVMVTEEVTAYVK